MTQNPELQFTLDDAVAEVLGQLTGLDLTYEAELDRYRAITRQLNRALRANALENEWAWYAATVNVGAAHLGDVIVYLPSSKRVRVIDDDALRLVNGDGQPVRWAYFVPRASLHKYAHKLGLWASWVRNEVHLSRPINEQEVGLDIHIPVMREPTMFRLPATGEEVDELIRRQPIDFEHPDLITARAAYYYAQSDPVMQPRVPTLENDYKNLMYQLVERDTRHTDSAYTNEYILPLESGLNEPRNVSPTPHSNFL